MVRIMVTDWGAESTVCLLVGVQMPIMCWCQNKGVASAGHVHSTGSCAYMVQINSHFTVTQLILKGLLRLCVHIPKALLVFVPAWSEPLTFKRAAVTLILALLSNQAIYYSFAQLNGDTPQFPWTVWVENIFSGNCPDDILIWCICWYEFCSHMSCTPSTTPAVVAGFEYPNNFFF